MFLGLFEIFADGLFDTHAPMVGCNMSDSLM